MKTLKLFILLLSVLTIGFGLWGIFKFEFTTWFIISTTVALVGLLISVILFNLLSNDFIAFLATTFFYVLYARLLSTVGIPDTSSNINIETGPGISNFFFGLSLFTVFVLFVYFIAFAIKYIKANNINQESVRDMVLLFLRVYIGLMFIPHFSGHILLGPVYFQKYVAYFETLNFYMPNVQLVIASIVEILVALAFVSGTLVRLSAILGGIYLLSTIYFGNHYKAGYIWAVEGLGYEFGSLWAVLCFIYLITGAGKFSLDYTIISKWPISKKIVSKIENIFA